MTIQEHLLTITVEECAEVAQRVTKVIRFGMEQIQRDADDKPEENPDLLTNRERVILEVNDLVAMLRMTGLFRLDEDRQRAKQEKVERYLMRSAACGTLDGDANGV